MPILYTGPTSGGLNMTLGALDTYNFITWTVRQANVAGGDFRSIGALDYGVQLYGVNLAYDAAGAPASGWLTRIIETGPGGAIFDLQGIGASVQDFNAWSATPGGSATAYWYLLWGDDQLYGSAESDALMGFGGTDYIDAGPGYDYAMYALTPGDYDVYEYAGIVAVDSRPGGGVEGIDRLFNVEALYFLGDGSAKPVAEVAQRFDAWEYMASYADLPGYYGFNGVGLFDHYLSVGLPQGRDITFNGYEYIASYADLMDAYGADKDWGAIHYIVSGAAQGRTTTFNALEYIASHADMTAAWGANEDIGAWHYITSGRFTGREVTFNGAEYVASRPALIEQHGDRNVDKPLSVYEDAGARAFIAGGGSTSFSGIEYIASYSDLIRAYTGNRAYGALPEQYYADGGAKHFIEVGYYQNRAESFDAAQYLVNYADVRQIAGSDHDLAAKHFIEVGFWENRTDNPV